MRYIRSSSAEDAWAEARGGLKRCESKGRCHAAPTRAVQGLTTACGGTKPAGQVLSGQLAAPSSKVDVAIDAPKRSGRSLGR